VAALRGGGAVANERGTPAAARKHPGEWVGKRTPGARRLKRDNRLRALEEILADAGVYDYMHQIPQMYEIYDHTYEMCDHMHEMEKRKPAAGVSARRPWSP